MAGGFDSLGLMPEILRAVNELQWSLPTDIQDEAIPLILGGGDVMAAAETGSGKTAAFSLPMIQCVHEWLRSIEDKKEQQLNDDTNDVTMGTSDKTIIPCKQTIAYDIKLNHNDKDAIISIDINTNGLQASSSADKIWGGGRADHGVRSGRYYYEVRIIGTGICRLGWATMASHHELGKDAQGFGYGGTAMKSSSNAFEAYGVKYSNDDIVGCYINLDDHTISYSVNGISYGVAFNIPENLKGTVLFPAYALKGAAARFNFGSEPFKHLPTDSSYVSLASSPKGSIVNANTKEAFQIEGKRLPLALILLPSRDLAEQVYNDIESMSKYVTNPTLKTVMLVGGDDIKRQQKKLAQEIDIAVGTIGRVQELVKSNMLNLSQVRFFILDEADYMVDKDNIKDVMQLYNACPTGGTGDNRLQVCFFSATLHSPDITALAAKICFNPTWVDLKGIDSVPETVHHVNYKVDIARDIHLVTNSKTKSVTDKIHTTAALADVTSFSYKSSMLKEIKQQILIKLLDKYNMSQCIVFCRTNLDCDNLESFLCAYGGGKKFTERTETGKEHAYSCCVLAGMRDMSERRRNLEAFKEGSVRIMICTDVAARGIDIKNLPYCINMTLPDESENYIHRVGRVGRANCMGLAISIIGTEDCKEQVWYHTCNNRGKNCSNLKLTSEGGCTVMYDEGALMAAVEKRLKQTVLSIDIDFNLPSEIKALNAEYGEVQSKDSRDNKDSAVHVHVEQLKPAVQALAELEYLSQNNFLLLQQFNGILQ